MTVDISYQYVQIIKDAVVRAPCDAVISANGFVYCEKTIMLEDGPTVDYKWNALAKNPTSPNAAWFERRRLLHSLRMHVPTKDDLARKDRCVPDAYFANDLGIELHDERYVQSTDGSAFDFALGTLPIINDRQFVLTLDFVMKNGEHERTH